MIEFMSVEGITVTLISYGSLIDVNSYLYVHVLSLEFLGIFVLVPVTITKPG